ncbi:ABC transporter substrate-binding protein [Streptomyces sp. NPDC048106]|uniref:ABC transporter substrate-binding protein n=1 Tax=Streptomyces sp. NPDC048106 TaxID=3155750 RepID=UPI003456CE9C
MSYRPVLAAMLTAMVLLTAACSGSGGTASGDRGLTFALDTEPSCLDPQVSMADATALITRGVVDSLVSQDRKGLFHPWLATRWETSSDLRTYTFHLRAGVTFHDGTPLDATAVKASFDRIVAPATKSLYARSLIGPYRDSTVLDARTVRVRLSRPFQPFLQAVSTAYLGIQSPKAFTTYAGSLCDHVVGSGPYVFDKHVHQQQVTLHANPKYAWGPEGDATGKARIPTLTFRFLPEAATRVGALRSGQVDGISPVPTPDVPAVTADSSLTLVRTEAQGASYGLYLNTARAPFDDRRVRQAFQRSLDVDTLVRSVYGGTFTRAWSILTPTSRNYDAKTRGSWSYDLAAADRLLDQAGWTGRDSAGYRTKDGRRLRVVWPATQAQLDAQQRGVLGQGIQAAAKKAGIEVVRPVLQNGPLYEAAAKGTYDILDQSWGRADPDILRTFLDSKSLPMTGQNMSRVQDPRVDRWVDGAVTTADERERDKDYAQAQRWVIQQATVVPVFVPAYLVATRKNVRGLTADPAGFPRFEHAWIAG